MIAIIGLRIDNSNNTPGIISYYNDVKLITRLSMEVYCSEFHGTQLLRRIISAAKVQRRN